MHVVASTRPRQRIVGWNLFLRRIHLSGVPTYRPGHGSRCHTGRPAQPHRSQRTGLLRESFAHLRNKWLKNMRSTLSGPSDTFLARFFAAAAVSGLCVSAAAHSATRLGSGLCHEKAAVSTRHLCRLQARDRRCRWSGHLVILPIELRYTIHNDRRRNTSSRSAPRYISISHTVVSRTR